MFDNVREFATSLAPAGACPSLPNYVFHIQHDVTGAQYDLKCVPVGNMTVAEIAAECAHTPGCVAFNLHMARINGLPHFCLQRATAPLTNSAQRDMPPDRCHGTYVLSESPLRTSVCQGCRKQQQYLVEVELRCVCCKAWSTLQLNLHAKHVCIHVLRLTCYLPSPQAERVEVCSSC